MRAIRDPVKVGVTTYDATGSGVSIALLSLAVAACVASSSGSPEPVQVIGQTVISCPACPSVTVTGVVDGDTIDTDMGRIRFYGVDTPERGERCFTEATEATRRLAGSQVRLEDGPRLTDRYDRRLAYVYDLSGNSIDVQLVAGGFPRAWTQDGQHRDTLVALEASARENGAGCLWGKG